MEARCLISIQKQQTKIKTNYFDYFGYENQQTHITNCYFDYFGHLKHYGPLCVGWSLGAVEDPKYAK